MDCWVCWLVGTVNWLVTRLVSWVAGWLVGGLVP